MGEMGLKMNDEIELEENVEINEIVDEEDIEEEEVVVSIGEEAPPPEEHTQAPEWVRELRKTNRELQRQNRELQGKLQAAPPACSSAASAMSACGAKRARACSYSDQITTSYCKAPRDWRRRLRLKFEPRNQSPHPPTVIP